jgi:hypothetical protein
MALNRVAEAIETSRSPQRKKPEGLVRRRQYTPEEDAIIQQDFAAELPGWRDPRAQALSRSGALWPVCARRSVRNFLPLPAVIAEVACG